MGDFNKDKISSEKITCPKDLNQYLICEPIFENTFSPDDCESRKFYGDCHHCFASAIAKRDRQIRQSATPQTDILEQIIAEINTSNRGTCDYYIVDRIEEIINEYQKGGAE